MLNVQTTARHSWAPCLNRVRRKPKWYFSQLWLCEVRVNITFACCVAAHFDVPFFLKLNLGLLKFHS